LAFFLTICVAFLGAFLGLKLRIPAGTLVGSMLAVAVFNVVFEAAYMPSDLKVFTQIATGTYIGAKLSKADIINLKYILKPAIILSAIMLLFTVAMGMLICVTSDLSAPTALFSMAPASIADMTLASMDFEDAEPVVVALIQTLRVVFSLCILPPLIKRITVQYGGCAEKTDAAKAHVPHASVCNLFITISVGLLAGFVGKLLGIPGGAITFSMLGCAAFQVLTGRGYMPLRLRRFIQIFAGALIGCTVGAAEIRLLINLWEVVVLAVVGFILLDIVAACAIAKTTDMDLITALFSCAPGGLTDMALIAEDMGADGVKVAGMQIVRLVSIVATYPTIIGLIVQAGIGR